MSTVQLFNGQFIPAGEMVLNTSNRGFSYGDGFFESMKLSNRKLPFATEHWNRVTRVTAFLQIQLPEEFTKQSFQQYALQLAEKNGFQNARIKFQGYRLGDGRYGPESNHLGWSMTCEPIEHAEFVLNKTGLHVEVCTSHTINPVPQSSFKSSNSLPYVLGAMFTAKHMLDDSFLLDSQGFIAEATGSNVFLLKGNTLATPDLSNGGVAGVMRSIVLKEAAALGVEISEELVSPEDVFEADESFLTNASRGVQWIGAVGKKRFYKRFSSKLTDHINNQYALLS